MTGDSTPLLVPLIVFCTFSVRREAGTDDERRTEALRLCGGGDRLVGR
jgi:hypothetical protein